MGSNRTNAAMKWEARDSNEYNNTVWCPESTFRKKGTQKTNQSWSQTSPQRIQSQESALMQTQERMNPSVPEALSEASIQAGSEIRESLARARQDQSLFNEREIQGSPQR